MLNVPIVNDVFAIRGVYDRRQIAGFVDNVGTGQKDSNQTTIEGGRVLATLAPSAGTRLNYLFLDQTESTQDAGSTQPSVGPYAKSTLIPEPFDYRTTLHNLRLDQDLGFATLTATATYHEKVFSSQRTRCGVAVEVPHSTHYLFLERPEWTAQAILAFLSSEDPCHWRFD